MWRGWLAHWSLLECCKWTWVLYIVVGSIKEKERKLRDLITWSLAFQITASITYWLKQVIQTQDERRHIQELSGPVGCHLWKWYTTDHFLFTASHSFPHAKHKLLHSLKCSRTHGVKVSLPGPACEMWASLALETHGLKRLFICPHDTPRRCVKAGLRWSWALVFKRKGGHTRHYSTVRPDPAYHIAWVWQP